MRSLTGAEVRIRLGIHPMTRGLLQTITLRTEVRDHLSVYVAVPTFFGGVKLPEVAGIACKAKLHTEERLW